MKNDDKRNIFLMLPEHPDFNVWLSVKPPNWKTQVAQNDENPLFAITPESGVMNVVSKSSLNELMFDRGLFKDGSFEETAINFEEENNDEEESMLYYPSYFSS